MKLRCLCDFEALTFSYSGAWLAWMAGLTGSFIFACLELFLEFFYLDAVTLCLFVFCFSCL